MSEVKDVQTPFGPIRLVTHDGFPSDGMLLVGPPVEPDEEPQLVVLRNIGREDT